MRLLHTKSYRLSEHFNEEVPPYAILSHRWDDREATFEEIRDLRNPLTIHGFAKIRGACSLAQSDNYEYIWIDTCCINKSSSSELSEAINSMYSWYKKAAVCYAYLKDVQYRPEVRGSEWFHRGWTLQELIAPKSVIFFSRDWNPLGTKVTLRPLISSITGIEETILAGGNLDLLSVARKMSWASKRKTTRKEDMAYCLMGIFSVNMPLLYGEGDEAFIRLQEQIITQTGDQSIFAWTIPNGEAERRGLYGLLAPSPLAFKETGKLVSLFTPIHRRTQVIKIINRRLEVRVLLRESRSSERYWSFSFQPGTGFKDEAVNSRKPFYSAVLDCQMRAPGESGYSSDSWACIDMMQLSPQDGQGDTTLARINPHFIGRVSVKDSPMTGYAYNALYGGSSPSETWHKSFISTSKIPQTTSFLLI
ncbi:Vegetative incompatibility protein HET-E-1 [Fusarium odoratissimum]|uniref:Vegetative incompatibility protein HET-E-1 n=1 Tax=Fusarium oxysporum f. sp. cubense (strain race 4) TaxID=2502994 RepID=N1S9R2_FUSC4|nr:Vegetative incompatibility protein HET-E-1 [Fusarium odoratissimum]